MSMDVLPAILKSPERDWIHLVCLPHLSTRGKSENPRTPAFDGIFLPVSCTCQELDRHSLLHLLGIRQAQCLAPVRNWTGTDPHDDDRRPDKCGV